MFRFVDSWTRIRKTTDEPVVMVDSANVLRGVIIITIGFIKHVSGHIWVSSWSLGVLTDVMTPSAVVTISTISSLLEVTVCCC